MIKYIPQTNNTNTSYLCSTVCPLSHTETNKGGVCHFNQYIVNTVDMDGLNGPLLHVLQDALVPQSSIKTSIPICNRKQRGTQHTAAPTPPNIT